MFCFSSEPKSGFKIAFNMFDVDGDERVDKKEFLVVSKTWNAFGSQFMLIVFSQSFEL